MDLLTINDATLISVIVPVYKVEKYLDTCIESILNQTYPNLEIILVNDGSPDGCPRKCDEWSKRDSRIDVIHKPNGGLSSARNAGLDVANGQYVVFVDSDDWISADLCQSALTGMKHDQTDIVFFGYDEGSAADAMKRVSNDVPNECIMSAGEAVRGFLEDRYQVHAWQVMAKHELYDGIRFPEGRVMEDFATTYRLFAKAKQGVSCLNNALYHYRVRDKSIMTSMGRELSEDIVQSHLVNLYEVNNYAESRGLKEVFAPTYLKNLIWLYGRAPSKLLARKIEERIHKILPHIAWTSMSNSLKCKILLYRCHLLRFVYRFI